MKALASVETLTGWNILIEFNERGRDRKKIEKDVFFPKLKNADPQAPEMSIKNYGQMILNGVIRFMPKSEDVMQQAPLHAALKTGRVFEKIGSDPVLDEEGRQQFMIMGFNREISVAHPMTYVKMDGEWVPKILLPLFERQKLLERHKEIKDSITSAQSYHEVLSVLRKNTIQTEEKKVEEKTPSYTVVPLPKADGRAMQILPQGNITNTRKASTKLAVYKKWLAGKLEGTDLQLAKFFNIIPQSA